MGRSSHFSALAAPAKALETTAGTQNRQAILARRCLCLLAARKGCDESLRIVR